MTRTKKTDITAVLAQSADVRPHDAKEAGDYISEKAGREALDEVFKELIYPYPGQTTKTQDYTAHDRGCLSLPNKCRYRKNGLSTNRRVGYRLVHIADAIRKLPKGAVINLRKLAIDAARAYPV